VIIVIVVIVSGADKCGALFMQVLQACLVVVSGCAERSYHVEKVMLFRPFKHVWLELSNF